MPVIDVSEPLITILCLAAIICTIFLGHEIKKSIVPGIALGFCTVLLVIHAIQLFVFDASYIAFQGVLWQSLLYDFGFIIITAMGYLWVDDIEAKYRNKKSIDNSLDWFWSKI